MKRFSFAVFIMALLAFESNAQGFDAPILCSRKGPICKDCYTLAECVVEDNGGKISFKMTQEETCTIGFVCDEWSLTCVRGGTCRSKNLTCPSHPTDHEDLYPDPYSCVGYYGCENGDQEFYECRNGKGFDPKDRDCSLPLSDPLCNDFPALCEKVGQKGTLGDSQFSYECLEETKPIHRIYPNFTKSYKEF